MPTDRLPRGFAEMIATKGMIFPPSTFELGKSFRPRPSDVIITPWSKSGTTWLQHIFHGLRADGDTSFDDISRVTPWIEVADALGIDLDEDQGWEPRGFKSHYNHHVVPKGCRYIVSFREPESTHISYYRFYEGWLFEPGTVTLDEYLAPHLDLGKRKDYWTHLSSWWAMRDDPNVLLLSYEWMLSHARETVEAVNDFLGFDASEELVATVTRQSSREWMLAHADKFNDHLHRARSDEVGALPPGTGAVKVTTGDFDPARYELSDAARARMRGNWLATVEEPFGFADYEAFTAAVVALLDR